MQKSLKNLWVVVTRPVDQASGLCSAIEVCGGHTIAWPALQIEPIKGSDQTRRHIAQLKSYDHLIFISVNAVNFGLTVVSKNNINIQDVGIFAVGKTTANALHQAGIGNVYVPEIASSEGLLALPEFHSDHINGKRCLIFRGEGGNERLAAGLKQAGAAIVDYVEVYRRSIPHSDPVILEAHWQQKQLDIIIVTSVAGLDNLFAILGEKNHTRLLGTPLLTVSERIAGSARQRGFSSQLLIANSASEEDIIATLQHWQKMRTT